MEVELTSLQVLHLRDKASEEGLERRCLVFSVNRAFPSFWGVMIMNLEAFTTRTSMFRGSSMR